MRALRYDGQHVALVADAREPVALPGEAIVRPTRLGICATDVEIARGGSRFVGTLGHEFVGVVEEINLPREHPAPATLEARRRLKGRRVTGSINLVCGHCDLCRAGLSTHCRQRTVLGCSGRDGCFAERFAIPLINLHAVSDRVDDDRAVFAEPLAAAAHAAQMIGPESRPLVTVLGDGKLGLLTAQVIARTHEGVRLLGKHPHKFALCEKWGIRHRHIDDVGRRQDQDVVIDCTGSAGGLELAMQLVRPRGRIVLKSSVSPLPIQPGAPVPMPDHPAWGRAINLAPIVINEIELVGSRCGPIEAALDLLENEAVNVLPLITARFPFEQAVAALHAARQGGGQIKVLMEP